MKFPRISVLLVVILLAQAVLAVQVPLPHPGARPELYGGYSLSLGDYAHNQDSNISGVMNGWQASAKLPILPWIGIKADGSGYYRSDTAQIKPRVYFILFGPEVSQHFGRYNLFVHGLVGGAHLNGGNSLFPLQSNVTLAAAIGGGIDTRLAPHLAWRVTGDFLHTSFTAGGQETNQLHNLVSSNGRISTGLVIRF